VTLTRQVSPRFFQINDASYHRRIICLRSIAVYRDGTLCRLFFKFPIALYILGCAVIGIAATALLTDYTNKDISEEYDKIQPARSAAE